MPCKHPGLHTNSAGTRNTCTWSAQVNVLAVRKQMHGIDQRYVRYMARIMCLIPQASLKCILRSESETLSDVFVLDERLSEKTAELLFGAHGKPYNISILTRVAPWKCPWTSYGAWLIKAFGVFPFLIWLQSDCSAAVWLAELVRISPLFCYELSNRRKSQEVIIWSWYRVQVSDLWSNQSYKLDLGSGCSAMIGSTKRCQAKSATQACQAPFYPPDFHLYGIMQGNMVSLNWRSKYNVDHLQYLPLHWKT